MDPKRLKGLLEAISSGELKIEHAMRELQGDELKKDDLVYATVDLERQRRTGFPEVIYGASKTAEQIASILEHLNQAGQNAIATRVEPAKARQILVQVPQATYAEVAQIVHCEVTPIALLGKGEIGVLCAGTSDLPSPRRPQSSRSCSGIPSVALQMSASLESTDCFGTPQPYNGAVS